MKYYKIIWGKIKKKCKLIDYLQTKKYLGGETRKNKCRRSTQQKTNPKIKEKIKRKDKKK